MEVYWLSIKDRRLKIEFEEAKRLGGIWRSVTTRFWLALHWEALLHIYNMWLRDNQTDAALRISPKCKPLGPESWRSLAQLLYTNERTLLQDPRRWKSPAITLNTLLRTQHAPLVSHFAHPLKNGRVVRRAAGQSIRTFTHILILWTPSPNPKRVHSFTCMYEAC